MAKAKPLAPFSEADRDTLERAKQVTGDLLGKFDRAESCGEDCQALRRTHKELSDQLQQIEQTYFSGARKRGK